MNTLIQATGPFKAVPIVLNDRLLQEAYQRILDFKVDIEAQWDEDRLIFSEALLAAQGLLRSLQGFGHDQTIWEAQRALVRELDRFVWNECDCDCPRCYECRRQELEKLREIEFNSERAFQPALAIIEKAATNIFKKGLRQLRKVAA